jgi:hypothetical protein
MYVLIRLRTAFKPRSELCMTKDGIGCECLPFHFHAALNNLPYTCLCATVCRMAFLRKCALRTHRLQVAVQTSYSARANQDTRAPMAVNACCASQTGLFPYIPHCTLFNIYSDSRIDILRLGIITSVREFDIILSAFSTCSRIASAASWK